MEYEALAIVGPTASGKTRRAVSAARMLGGEILSGDSRQVYCGMDLGTGKDLEEYGAIPYHLVDIAPAGSKFNLYQYLKAFDRAYADIRSRGAFPVICGGSGLYVESALSGVRLPEVPEDSELRASLQGKSLDELADILASMKTLHNVTDIDTAQRAIRAIEIQTYYQSHPQEAEEADREKAKPLNALVVGVDIPRDDRRKRIVKRLDARLEAGMLDEVSRLLDSGIDPDDLIYYGLEYKFLTLHLIGRLSYEEIREQLATAIRQFAKRQMTWLRGMERRGFTIHWLPYDLSEDDFLNRLRQLMMSGDREYAIRSLTPNP